MTDPATTVVFFSLAFLAACVAGAAWDHYTSWRDEQEHQRNIRRTKVLLRRIGEYGYGLDKAPDSIPAWMEKAA